MTKVVLAANVLIKGGVWRHVVDLAGGLQARGCQVAIALPKRASLLRNEAIGQGLSVHDLAPRSRVDIWHVHLADTYDLQMLAALPLARSLAGAVIITEHLPRSDASDPSANQRERSFGAWPAKTVFKRAEYAMCHRVVCVSEASRRFIMIRYGLDRRKVIAIPNGIEVAAVPTAWPQGSPVFVAIGAVIEQKGFDVLVDA